MKRLVAIIMVIVMVFTIPLSVNAASAWMGDDISIIGYNANTDYMKLMIKALNDGSLYAMQMGAIYERQRNLKIDKMGLKYPKTHYFDNFNSAAEILQAIEEDKKPKYTEEDLDLVARIVNAEAGCDWIPDWVMRMVASVVVNRKNSPYFPNTIRGVVYQPGVYGPVYNGMLYWTPSKRAIENARYVLENGPTCPANVTGQSGVISGSGVYTTYYDRVLGTTIYFCYT